MITPDWDHAAALETLEKLRGLKLRRPNGTVTYEVVDIEQIHCGTAIRIKRFDDDDGYLYCHNALLDEMTIVEEGQ